MKNPESTHMSGQRKPGIAFISSFAVETELRAKNLSGCMILIFAVNKRSYIEKTKTLVGQHDVHFDATPKVKIEKEMFAHIVGREILTGGQTYFRDPKRWG